MQMVRFRFSEKDKASGWLELAKRIKIIALRNNEYLIAKDNLELFNELGLEYEILGEEGFDSAIRKIRNTSSTKV